MGLFDSKVYGLNPEVALLAARLVGRSGILQEGENCALLHNVHTHPVFQMDSRVRPRRQGPDLCYQPLSSSPFKFGVFSDKYKHSQQLLGWEGRRAWCLSSSLGGAARFRPFLTMWMPTPDIWAKGGKSPKAAWDPSVGFFAKQESSLGCRPQRWFSNEGF